MLALAAAAGCFCAPAVAAQDAPIRSVVARFSFDEDRRTGQELPRGWYKSAIPDRLLPQEVRFPHYLRGKLTDRHAHDGKLSFAMTLDGGNVAYTYTDGVETSPDSDYLLTGWVRTDRLKVARAQARAFLVDRRGRPVSSTAAVSPPMGGPGAEADGRWRRFRIFVSGEHAEAMRLQITLSLIQPEIWQPADQQALDQQDITGECFWDDITVYRVPRVRVTTDVPAGVFVPGIRPRLITHLEGLDPAETNVLLTVRAASGTEKVLRILAAPELGAPPRQTQLLPELPPGLYAADLAVSAGDEVLMHAMCRFAVLGELPLASDSRLDLDASAMPVDQWPILLALARRMRAGGVKLPAWPAAPADAQEAMAAMLSRLHDSGLTATLVMDGAPPMPEADTPPTTLARAMAHPSKELTDAVAHILARHASRVSNWQLTTGRREDEILSAELPAAYRTGRQWTDRLVADKGLLLGWNAMYEYGGEPAGRLCLRIPAALAPEQIPDQLADFGPRVEQVHLTPQVDAAARLGRIADFALRYGYTRAAGFRRVSIDPPWRRAANGQIEPTELLLVARTLAAYLGDADCVGTALLDESNLAMIFRRTDGEGVMMLHRRDAGGDNGVVRLDLPETAYGVDLWGRKFPLKRSDGDVVVRPQALPTLIAGCDATALALRASVRFEPSALPSTYTEHPARITFTNPYTQPVAGTIRLTAPDGWTLRPRVLRFNAAAGGEWSAPLTVLFPYSATSGLKRIDVSLQVDAREGMEISLPAFLHLSLPTITLDPVYTVDEDGRLQVQVCVVNYGDRPISFRCFAHVGGRARQSSIVQDLAGGAKVVKVFRFFDGAALFGESLHTGLRQIDGKAVLNHAVEIR